jgi:uncharacterized RDD family membrane protein YckC
VRSEERLTIETPEQIALELPVAGIGSRFLAVAVDTLLQAGLWLSGILLMTATPVVATRLFRAIGPAIALLLVFCIYWGYFAFFECVWSGRTPGKRVARIRVIKDTGRTINVYEAAARNVLRTIDFLPIFYGVGIVVMMLNRHSRRIGDYVAGTVVVHDRPGARVQPAWHAAIGASVPHPALTKVTAEELQLVEAYLQRRFELDPLVREPMAEQIARRITGKTGLRPEEGQSTDDFLEAVARRVRDGARFR